jgi:hypothetical protein
MSNVRMNSRELKQFCELDESTKELLKNAMADCGSILKQQRRELIQAAPPAQELVSCQRGASKNGRTMPTRLYSCA